MNALLISDDRQLQEKITALCAVRNRAKTGAADSVDLTRLADRGAAQQLAAGVAAQPPHLVIIDGGSLDPNNPDHLEIYGAQFPHSALLLLCRDGSPDYLMRAMRAGVREVVMLPLDATALDDAFDRIAKKNAHAATGKGKILAFVSCKGGSGVTFIASNFAFALAARSQKKVLLLDINRQFGDAALYLSDQIPAMTLPDVCADISRIDAAFLASSLMSITPGLGVLAGAIDPGRAADIKPGDIDALLQLARQHYDHIIVDVGRQIDAVSIRALDMADTIYPVLQLSLPYLRDGRRLLEIFRTLGYRPEIIRPILNRYDKSGSLYLSDLEAALGARIAHTLPSHYTSVSDSLNQGIALHRLAGKSAINAGLHAMVDALLGARAKPEKSRWKGWSEILARWLPPRARLGT